MLTIRIVLFILLLLVSMLSDIRAQNTEYDIKFGAKAAIQLEQQIGIYHDTLLTNYITSIGNKLVEQLGPQPFSYQFHVLDTEEPNAFALPGGYVYVTRGLLPIANSEDELACVIAHEIIHSHQRHTIKQLKKSILPGILQIPGNIVGGTLGNGMSNIINLGTQAWMAGYSRKHERESDKLGMEIAEKAGYQPIQLGTILTNLSNLAEHTTGEAEKKNYLQGHPYTPERVEFIQKEASKFQVDRNLIQTDSAFLFHFDGLVIGQNPEQGIVEDNQLIHPILKLAFQFPDNWSVVNSPHLIVAVEPGKEGVILLKAEENYEDPFEAANAFKKAIENKNVEILVDDNTIIDEFPAHIVAVKMEVNDQLVYLESIWVRKDTLLYNVMGYGYKKHMGSIQHSIMSFRGSNDEELQQLTFHSIKVIKPKSGDTMESLLIKNETLEYLDYSLLINNAKKENSLKSNELIKVIVKSSFY